MEPSVEPYETCLKTSKESWNEAVASDWDEASQKMDQTFIEEANTLDLLGVLNEQLLILMIERKAFSFDVPMISTLAELKALRCIPFKDQPGNELLAENAFQMTVDRDEDYEKVFRLFMQNEKAEQQGPICVVGARGEFGLLLVVKDLIF